MAPICQKQGLISADLILEWPKIVGPEVATICQVLKISFPTFSRQQGCLHIQTNSAMATALTYSQLMIIERINQYYGYQAISQIRVFHKPLALKATKKLSTPIQFKELPSEWQALTQSVGDENLQQALEKLAQGLQSKTKKSV